MADNYRIVGQKQNVHISPAGIGFIDVWDITYQVTSGPSKGLTANVTVPEGDYNAAYVKAAIEDNIKRHDSVASL